MKKNILLQAPVFSVSGYGAHSKDIALSLLRDNRFNVGIIPTGWGANSITGKLDKSDENQLIFGCNNIINNERIWVQVGIPNEFERKGYFNIGITAGLESTHISQLWIDGCNRMDLIVVPTFFTKEAFERCGVTKKVEVVPEGVDASIWNVLQSEDASFAFLKEKFNFLCIGQWPNFPMGKDRKQISLLVTTFMKYFEGREDVSLTLKTYINNLSSADRFFTAEKIKTLKKGIKYPEIHLIHGELSNDELSTLYKNSKVYVSMSSGEGWNRPTAEAAACGLPIIITNWSGHLDYLSEKNASLIPFQYENVPMEQIKTGNWYENGMKWAMVNTERFGEEMLNIKKDYLFYKNRAVLFSSQFLEKYNFDTCYSVFNQLVAAVESPKQELNIQHI
jgi:glycosyltransferase involved in cell wall biosynthesis